MEAREAARLTVVVVLPTPPFWLATARICALMCFAVVLSVDGWIVPLFGMLGLFSDDLFADDDDMAFGIELGDVQCFDFFDGDAFGQFVDFFLRVYAFHGRPVAAVFEEVLGPVDEVGEFGKGAAGDDVGAAVGGGFYAAADDADVFKAEFDDGLLQKGGFFGVGIEEGDVEVGAADGGGDAGLSAAGADVEHGLGVFDIGQEGQAVEQVMADGLGGIAQGGQVVGFVPLLQQGGIV